jgi:hypothetical protein
MMNIDIARLEPRCVVIEGIKKLDMRRIEKRWTRALDKGKRPLNRTTIFLRGSPNAF